MQLTRKKKQVISDIKFVKARYFAFVLDEDSRQRLMKACPPEFEKVVCHHITIALGVTEGKFKKMQAYWKNDKADVEAHVNVTGDGVQAIVCTINKDSMRMFAHEGGTYHVTMSLTPPHKPAESNRVIAAPSGTQRTVIPFDENGEAFKLTGKFEFVM